MIPFGVIIEMQPFGVLLKNLTPNIAVKFLSRILNKILLISDRKTFFERVSANLSRFGDPFLLGAIFILIIRTNGHFYIDKTAKSYMTCKLEYKPVCPKTD